MRFLALLLALGSVALAQLPLPATGKFPSLLVQVTVGTPERAATRDFYHKNMQIKPRATIEGASSMLPIPAAEIEMLVITKIIDFQTNCLQLDNCLQLENIARTHPEKRDEVLKMGRGAPFPNEFK